MTDDDDRRALIEQVAAAWRPIAKDGTVRAHPAWHDLDDEGRNEAFALASATRTLEAALDPEGLSTTAKAVLARIRGITR
jgi:hypothetical protein